MSTVAATSHFGLVLTIPVTDSASAVTIAGQPNIIAGNISDIFLRIIRFDRLDRLYLLCDACTRKSFLSDALRIIESQRHPAIWADQYRK